jgi:spermidine synthase
VLTRWLDDTRLYINGNLQFSSRDEHRYHEALVHPALQACPGPAVLVLGGGDGLAVRESAAPPQRRAGHPGRPRSGDDATCSPATGCQLNGGARDPRVTTINADAGAVARDGSTPTCFDLIVADFPDPSNFASASSTRCRSTG